MIFVSLFPTLFHLFILMCFCSTSVKCFVSCPAKHLINSLIPSEMLNPNATANKSSLCDCTSIQEGGWEITCFTDLTSSGNNEFSEVFPSDYGFTDYNALSQAFNVKYEARRFIEISCDKYAPRYKPAMFQGFDIEEIEAFRFTNCPMSDIQLSVLLHRTSPKSIISSAEGDKLSKSGDNETLDLRENIPEISRVRQLTLKRKGSINSTMLNMLLSGLDDLEQLHLLHLRLETPVAAESNASSSTNDTIFVDSSQSLTFSNLFPKLRVLQLKSFLFESPPQLLTSLFKGLNKLESLNLNANVIKSLPGSLFLDSRSTLKRLYLLDNTISQLHPLLLEGLQKLEILDLSHNALTDLPVTLFYNLTELKYLRMRGNPIQRLDESLLSKNINLGSLDLSNNRNLTSLPVRFLQGLKNLANLTIAHGILTQISDNPVQFFAFAPNLEQLDMRNNQITKISFPNLFATNHKLNNVNLAYNNISALSGIVFSSNASSILNLNLYGNELAHIDDNTFLYLRNLKRLNLGFNSLEQTSHNLFLPLQHLEELNLSKNRIRTINSRQSQIPFGLGPSLRIVDLSRNNLTDFDSEFNSINWSLYLKIAELDLRFNLFHGKLRVPVFSSSTAPIISLDLSNNLITSVDIDDILQHELLSKELRNHNNNERKNDNRYIGSQASLQTIVRLENNPIKCDCNLLPFLRYAKSTPNIQPNSKDFYRTTIFDLNTELTCAEPANLKDFPLESIELSHLLCPISAVKTCPTQCNCSFRAFDQTVIVDCEKRNIAAFPLFSIKNFTHVKLDSKKSPVNTVILNFSYNRIQNLSNLNELFVTANENGEPFRPQFVELYFDGNNITQLNEKSFLTANDNSINNSSVFPAIKVFSLRHNHIRSISPSTLRAITPLMKKQRATKNSPLLTSKLFLGNNPYNCTPIIQKPDTVCELREFKSWLTSNHEIVGDINDIMCENINYNSSAILFEIPDEVLCPLKLKNDAALLTLTVVCIVLAFGLFVVSVLYYRNKQTVLAFIYIHINPVFVCLSFSEDDLDEDKLYDAFVSYSSADRDIVMQLIDKLEVPNSNNVLLQQASGASIHEGISDQIVPENEFKKSHANLPNSNNVSYAEESHFTLCIHERDWLPGNLISWNIVNSVQNSRRTILILSKEFIQSIWFQVEFHTAYYQMLEDKIDRLIVIVRGPLPPKEEMDKDLVFLLTTKTYLVWGEKWFWEKLRYALPHKKKDLQRRALKSETQHLNNAHTPVKNGTGHKTSEVMKDKIDKTIVSHFQLDSSPRSHQPQSLRNTNREPAYKKNNKSRTKNATGRDNFSFVNETQT